MRRNLIIFCFFVFLANTCFSQAPGNVSTSFIQWLKANAGTSTTTDGVGVQTWTDQFGATENATQADATRRPTFRNNTNNVNFNPYIRFDGTSDLFTVASNASMSNSNDNNKTLIVAFRASNDISSRQLIYRERNETSGFHLYINNGSLHCSAWKPSGGGTNWTAYNNSIPISQNEVIIASFVFNGPNNASGTLTCFKNGLQFANVSGVGRLNGVNTANNINIGGRFNSTATRSETGALLAAATTDFSSVDYLEQAYYNATLTPAERNRAESYLAIKYGVTLDQSVATDYVRSDGTVIYSATVTHNSYRNDIAGIGIDNNSALNQPASRSVNSDSIVTMSNASGLANNEFLVWGNDNDDNGVAQEILTGLPPSNTARLDRVWRVDQTGDVGTVRVEFNLSALSVSGTVASHFLLLHKNTNSDFTTGATVVNATSYSSGVVRFDNVDFVGDDYFTLVTLSTPPPPNVILSSNLSSIVENGGVAVITATLNQVLGVNVTVNLAVNLSSTATQDTDYSLSATQITILAGNLTGSVNVTSLDDGFSEGSETIVLDISSVVNASELVPQQVTVSITDDEAANNACDGQERLFTTRLASGQVNTYTIAGGYLGTSTSAYTGNYEMIIDPDEEYRYLASYDDLKITRANFDGSGEIVLYDTTPNQPFQIAINRNQGKIYWTEWGPSTNIMCANLDGTGTPVAIASGLYYPTGMQTDVNTGRLFVYYGFESPVRLDRTVTDGNCTPVTFTTIQNTGLNLAYNLTIDPPGNQLFFVDYNGQFIRRINTDGTGLTNIWNLTAPGDLMRDIIYNKNTGLLYWVHTNGVIQRAEADGTGGVTTVVSGANAFSDSRSIDICVDDAPPRLVSFYSVEADTRYCPSASIQIRAVYDEAIFAGSTLTVTLNNGATVLLDTIAGNEISGVYTVGATGSGETIADLSIASISAEAVSDANNNIRANSTVPLSPNNLGDTSNLVIDTSAPSLSTVTPVPAVTGNVNPPYTFSSDESGTISVGGSCGSVTTALSSGNNTITLDSDGAGGPLSPTGGPLSDGVYSDCIITATDALGCNTGDFNIPSFQIVETPTVTLSIDNASISETGGVATVTATLSNVFTSPVTVNLAFSGTATNINDYTRSATSIVIPASSLTGTITINAVGDLLDEVNETVIVDIDTVTNGTEDGVQQVTTTIIDDDATPTVTLSATPLSITEDGSTSTITATLSAISGQDVTVNLVYSGTASSGVDYISASSILITAGNLTGSTILTATDDNDLEDTETVIVDIDTVTNGTESGTQQVTIQIFDDVVCNQPPWPAPHGMSNYIAMSFESDAGPYVLPSGDDFDNYLLRDQNAKDAKRDAAYAFFLSEYGLNFSTGIPGSAPGSGPDGIYVLDDLMNPKAFLSYISFHAGFQAKINAASGYLLDESEGGLKAGIYQVLILNNTSLEGNWGGNVNDPVCNLDGKCVPFGTVIEFGEYELDIAYKCSDGVDEDIVEHEKLLVAFQSQKPSLADFNFQSPSDSLFRDHPQIFEYDILPTSPNFAGGEITGRTEVRDDIAISSIVLTVD